MLKLDSGQTDYIDEHVAVVQYHVATLVNNDQPFGVGKNTSKCATFKVFIASHYNSV